MAEAKRILLIDDDVLILELFKAVLSAEGYRVNTAKNLAELDRRLHAFDERPDLVLVDVQMPELNGDEITLMLRTVRNVDVPVFLVSSLDERDLAERAADVGATGWISKTAGIKTLAKKVNDVLKKPEKPS
ncbi:MAG: response regulator [Deltaproteobacteria bacterium]|nr:response regulator [Deltaproteobacteria bacterium]